MGERKSVLQINLVLKANLSSRTTKDNQILNNCGKKIEE
jgi:hypothetical protein